MKIIDTKEVEVVSAGYIDGGGIGGSGIFPPPPPPTVTFPGCVNEFLRYYSSSRYW